MKEILHSSAALVHHLQKERGLVAAYLKSGGGLFENRLSEHIICCDDVLRNYLEIAACDIKGSSVQASACFLRFAKALEGWRGDIKALRTEGHQALDFYTYKLINPLIQNMVEILQHSEHCSHATGNVFNALLQWKENIGLERALGTRALIAEAHSAPNAVNDITYDEFIERLTFFVHNAEANRRTCFLLANPQQRKLLEELSACRHSTVDDWHAMITAGDEVPRSLLADLTPERWFDMIDEKMNVMHIYESKFIDLVFDSAAYLSGDSPVCGSGGLLHKRMEVLRHLPLFKDIGDDDLADILSCAGVRRYRQGKMLLEAGAEARQFHLILQGWVKLHSLSEDGIEVVLQMLNVGDAIMEQSVLLQMPYPAAATAVKEVELLCIPTQHIHDCIARYPSFAKNFLQTMGARLQSFIWHVETIRSHNAEHRLGWFLLRLLLERKHGVGHVRLPYNKAVLASYLGMQPETLSRVLSKFKERGFRVNNDTIIVPEFSMLCGFCDSGIAGLCHYREELHCNTSQETG